ncbi:archaellin/type IV pilin N-terminal domain-containing protein [Natronomonas salsuginis]|uniref:Flagellin n=1 Tax=Natronomonas salsuginis TaxID=2217661 RepID=A0A4U5JCR8_9EURY|nr:flagellin [Natronomonas salsuginis]TKR26405.1 flagellin [Natronomonas salsuginis]
MFDTEIDNKERGQVGIGTLIVFIALVLVAAIAAGVLINTAGFLQTQAQSTGEESTEQVSTNLVFLSSTGTVTEDGSSNPAGIKSFNTTVQLGPGSNAINLNDSTISVFTDSGDSVEFDGVDETGITLSGSEVLSTDSSSEDATATLEFDVAGAGIGETIGGTEALGSGTTVDIVITTPSGTQAETSFIIEDPLDPQLSEDQDIRLS